VGPCPTISARRIRDEIIAEALNGAVQSWREVTCEGVSSNVALLVVDEPTNEGGEGGPGPSGQGGGGFAVARAGAQMGAGATMGAGWSGVLLLLTLGRRRVSSTLRSAR
jgi:hypothetical protein